MIIDLHLLLAGVLFVQGFWMGDDRKQAFVAFACSTMATFIPGIKTQSDLNSHLALGRG
jgi:uncharacterized protein YfiM (DUF2279 family)